MVDKSLRGFDRKTLRFAFIATMAAFGLGQIERLHLGWGDHHTTYTIILNQRVEE